MKQAIFAFVFVFYILGVSFTVSAQDEIYAEDVVELKIVYTKLDKAAKTLDLKAFETYLGENFRLETVEENLNKQQTLTKLKHQFALTNEISEAVTTINKIEIVNGNYVLDVTFVLVGKLATPNGKSVKFSVTSKSTDIWRRDRWGNWQEHRQIDLGNKIIIESKEINLA